MDSLLEHVSDGMNAFRLAVLKNTFVMSVVMPMLPRSVRWTLRKLYFLPAELAARARGGEHELMPPLSQIFDGAGQTYIITGRRFVDRLVASGCLRPDSRVLDIGCGMGRLPVALSDYLGPRGTYDGVDVVPAAIQWGQTRITPRFPRFHFTLADLYNAEYNPSGRQRASEYRFPFPDASFDLIVLSSVFTHLRPADLEHYVAEISRLLAPDGHSFATLFLLNQDSVARMQAGQSPIVFKHLFGQYASVSARLPELSISYDEQYVRQTFECSGLVDLQIQYGGWCGREPLWSHESGMGDQDVVQARKPALVARTSADINGGRASVGSSCP